MARIEPLTPPYEADVHEQLTRMMPPGVDPIGLFRTFAHNMAMTTAMGGWGGYELGRTLSLSKRRREIVIDRVTARCGCEYEWGVHVAFFADAVGLSEEQVRSLTSGTPADDCWADPTERLLIEAVDSLHDTSDIDDDLFARLGAALSDAQLLDLFMLTGWYHAISFCARAARVDLEQGAPTFATFASGALTVRDRALASAVSPLGELAAERGDDDDGGDDVGQREDELGSRGRGPGQCGRDERYGGEDHSGDRERVCRALRPTGHGNSHHDPDGRPEQRRERKAEDRDGLGRISAETAGFHRNVAGAGDGGDELRRDRGGDTGEGADSQH